MDVQVKYFESPGDHAKDVFDHVKSIVDARGIKDIVVASTRGETGLRACNVFDPAKYNVTIVTHSQGFITKNQQEFRDDNKKAIIAKGGKILTGTHAFSGVETGISKKLAPGNVLFPVEVFARIVRLVIGDGIKVCMEIAVMAADAGLVRVDKDVLCIAGTGTSADTACIIKPAYSRDFTELRLKQILCKPE
nr:pyruvate kinase alpha/beta domain-containing protein [Candidatus Sigynarchaeota archaeon]